MGYYQRYLCQSYFMVSSIEKLVILLFTEMHINADLN